MTAAAPLLPHCLVSQMSIQNFTLSPQQRQHWLSEQALLGTHAARIASGVSIFYPTPVSERLQLLGVCGTAREAAMLGGGPK